MIEESYSTVWQGHRAEIFACEVARANAALVYSILNPTPKTLNPEASTLNPEP